VKAGKGAQKKLTSSIFPETPEFAGFQIIMIIFHGKSFALERDIFIGQETVLQPEVPEIIFDDVPQIKEDDEQLQLLSQMYFFVIDERFIVAVFGPAQQNHRKKCDRRNFRIFEE